MMAQSKAEKKKKKKEKADVERLLGKDKKVKALKELKPLGGKVQAELANANLVPSSAT